MKKRGQVTILIIVGMLIFLSFVLVSYLKQTYFEAGVKPEIYIGQSVPEQFKSLNSYIEFCIKDVTEPRQKAKSWIHMLSRKGGKLSNYTEIVEYLADEINVLCTQTPNKGCVQNILLKQDMESELSTYFKLQLLACVDLNEFKKRGYEVKADNDNLKFETTIAKDDIVVKVNYPITLVGQDLTLKTSEYLHKINLPLGRLYELAIDIVNEEASKGYFNKDDWMINNNAQIIIKKHQPYPDIVYSLTKGELTFQFGIKGIDSVGKIYPDLVPIHGCCNIGESCFKNLPEEKCDGEYNADPKCECKPVANYSNYNNFMSNCWLKKHGESWCSYDSIAGKSLDYVGSRHYKYSCINGEEIIEECRDFREELCTEQGNKAVCRVNRWQDCHACTTKECCEDINLRDCAWDDSLKTDIKCTSFVPPGLRFWENKGNEICSVANEKKEFSGTKVNNAWVDDTARLCYYMGDCGNYRNIVDEITKNGFKNSDGQEQSYVYLENGYPSKSKNHVVSLALETRNQDVIAVEFKQPSNYPTVQEITAALKHLDSYKPDLFDTFKKKNIKRPALSRCTLWTAPTSTNNCRRCTEDGKACSEYRCKSLGESCQFTYMKGIPNCFAPGEGDTTPPIVSVDDANLPSPYNYTPATLGRNDTVWFRGYEILPEIEPHTPITIGIKTDEPTRCKITYLPESKFISLPPLWFGDNEYTTTHNITFRFPSKIEIPTGLFETFNLGSINDVIDVPGFTDKIKKYSTIKLLDEFKLGRYYLFVKCNDEYGNDNKDELFIRFKLNSELEDNKEPKIVAAVPENGSIVSVQATEVPLELYVDEPAECRASLEDKSYDEMEFKFNCATSEYDMSDVGAGTYRCNSVVPAAERYFFRCADKPTPESMFYITLVKQENVTVLNGNVNLSDDVIVILDINELRDDRVKVGIDFEPKIEFSLNPLGECRFSNSSNAFDEMENTIGCFGVNETSECSGELMLLGNLTKYFIKCREFNITNIVNRNINRDSFVYQLRKSSGLNIVSAEPNKEVNTNNPKLVVETTGDVAKDGIKCTYNGYLMNVENGVFVKQMKWLNNFEEYEYNIECKNKFGDKASSTVKFTVVVSI